MNDTIDTLKIKVEGEGEGAVKTLDTLLTTLEKIKGTTSSRSIGSLTSKLESLKSSINSIKTKNLSKLSAIFSTLSNTNRINISPRLPERIRELGEAVSTLDGIDFSKLNEMASGLSALSRVSHVNLPRVSGGSSGSNTEEAGTDFEGTEEVPSRTVSENSLSRMDKFSSKLSEIKEKISKATGNARTFGSTVQSAFSDTMIGRFATKLKETITSLGRIALYRIMRSMIKQVTDAFKTGIDNMYQYSKTFNGSYAQSMDQLASANLTFKNSIGAIMAPLIELVTPWLDSVLTKLVEVNNTIAMVFAHLAGKSTYSKAVRVTTEYAEAADKASTNTEKTTKKVNELKRSLAGLDELTIIGEKLSSTPSTSVDNPVADKGLDYGSMFEEAPVDTAKVQEILDTLNTIWDVAKKIGIAIAAWELLKFLTSIGKVLTGLDNINNKLLGLTLMVVGFGLEFSGAFHIGYGDATLWDYIKTALGAALGIAGSLLVFGTGPLGWTIGITAAVAIAVAGITVGNNKRLADVVEEAFYEAGGTITISDLAEQFERYCKAVTDSNQPTIDLGKEIDDKIQNVIKPAADDILNLGKAVMLSSWNAEDYVPKIKDAINDLKTGTKDVLDDVYDNIVRAVSGSLFDSLSEAGIYVPELLDTLAKVKGETDKTVDDNITKMQELTKKFDEGKISSEEFYSKIETLTTEITDLTGATDPAKEAFDRAALAIQGIDWEDKDASDTAFAKIREAAENSRTNIDEAYESIKNSIEIAKKWSDDPQYHLYLDKILEAKGTERDRQLKSIGTYAQGMMNQVQGDLLLKLDDVGTKLRNEYSKSSWFNKLIHTEDSYVAKGLEEYKKNIIQPTEKEIKSLYKTLGVNGSTYASDAAGEIINGMFSVENPGGGKLFTLFSGSHSYNKGTGVSQDKTVIQAIKDYYTETGEAMPESLAAGIKAKQKECTDSWETLKDKMMQPFLNHKNRAILSDEGKATIDKYFESAASAAEVHSPSKRSARLMSNILQGMIPKDSDKNKVISGFESMLNTLFDRLETFLNRWRGSINTMFDDMAYGWKNADFRSDGSYNFKYLKLKTIQRFAQGGFPEDGFFYANHNELVGQFSNGRTAVANNEQIVEGISAGVSSANEQQNSLLREQNKLLRMLLEKDSSIEVTTIASAFNRKNQRDGKVTVPVSI